VKVGVTLENTGVSAYAGAAPLIQNTEVAKAALAIHSVEARHAAYLGVLDQRLPYPNGAFDPARTMEEVVSIASQFIVE
jgi:rubrerythrin